MAYIGSSPTYGVFDRQVLTGDGSTVTYNLDHMEYRTIFTVGRIGRCCSRTRIFVFNFTKFWTTNNHIFRSTRCLW